MIHVTDCLPFNAEGIDPDVLQRAADRGKKVHAAVHLIETATLNWETLEAELVPYCKAWMRFKRETGWTTDEGMSEYEVVSEDYGYIGHPDKRGRFSKLKHRKRRRTILEIKCVAVIALTTALQLSGYACGDFLIQRACVQLLPTSYYKLEFYDKRADWYDFLAKVRSRRWDLANGYITERERT